MLNEYCERGALMFDFIDSIKEFFDTLMNGFDVSGLLGAGLIIALFVAWIVLGLWDRIKP